MPRKDPPEVRPYEMLALTLTSQESDKARSVVSFLTSLAIQGALLAIAIVVPLMATDDLPSPDGRSSLLTLPAPPSAPRPPKAPPKRQQPASRPNASNAVSAFVVPLDIPEGIVDVPADDVSFVSGGDATSATMDVSPFVVGGLSQPVAPPPPPPTLHPVRVGGDIREPRLRQGVSPVYPAIARRARIQGVVVLEAVIDVLGNVTHLRVIESVPMLEQAAIDAVSQWKYEPTLLNGARVPVVVTVTVRFVLN